MTVDSRSRKRAAVADPEARKFLRKADSVLAQLIDARPDFRPRAWLDSQQRAAACEESAERVAAAA
jgi:hypothetical protein